MYISVGTSLISSYFFVIFLNWVVKNTYGYDNIVLIQLHLTNIVSCIITTICVKFDPISNELSRLILIAIQVYIAF